MSKPVYFCIVLKCRFLLFVFVFLFFVIWETRVSGPAPAVRKQMGKAFEDVGGKKRQNSQKASGKPTLHLSIISKRKTPTDTDAKIIE